MLGVLALTLVKVVARRWTGHAGAVLAFAALVAVVASGFNADAYVARTNLDWAANGKPLDLAYLESLSGDAWVALIIRWFVATRASRRSSKRASADRAKGGSARFAVSGGAAGEACAARFGR